MILYPQAKLLQKTDAEGLTWGGICNRGWVDVGRDPDVVQVGFGEQGLKEGVGVTQSVLLDKGGVSGKAVTPVQPWDAQLASALNEEEGGGCIRNSMNGIHSCQVQWPKLQQGSHHSKKVSISSCFTFSACAS